MTAIKLFDGMELDTETISPTAVNPGDLLIRGQAIFRATSIASEITEDVRAEPAWSLKTNREATGRPVQLAPHGGQGEDEEPPHFTRITAAY